ncbi:MAG: type II toxin-antitoxin system VapC family toxin [Geodermatophilaceae bacterium]|nr:type II toxin-antitoxin system VapC family toxin [Geodermatophilaceae bacterium]
MILLDTTVLSYAVGTEHSLREPCRHLLGAISSGAVRASTTIEVIQEFLHVRSRRRSREDAVELATAYLQLLSPLVRLDEDILGEAFKLYVATPGLGSFDALLAALAIQHSDTLVSADRAFAEVPDLRHVVPDAAGVVGLR